MNNIYDANRPKYRVERPDVFDALTQGDLPTYYDRSTIVRYGSMAGKTAFKQEAWLQQMSAYSAGHNFYRCLQHSAMRTSNAPNDNNIASRKTVVFLARAMYS